MWAGDGAKMNLRTRFVGAWRPTSRSVDRLGWPSSGPDGSTAVYINMH
jgi:hypothetical protein